MNAPPPNHALLAHASPAVVCRQTTKEYGHGGTIVRALRGVDLQVPMGALTLLVGPSGCGKTTLLSVIAGILDPTSGEVSVLGSDLVRLSGPQKTAFRRKNLGFIFQQYNLLPALTAAENAAVPLLIDGWPRARAFERAAEILTMLKLGERITARPATLSGGEQQRVAIARALVHHPRLIVCDEPTAALDSETGRSVMELLRNVAVEPDRAVIVVTHDARVFEFADLIARMQDGQVIAVEERTTTKSP